MGKNRYFPFGYYMCNGQLLPFPKESQYVREIFSDYVSGKSLQTIADHLNKQNAPYSETCLVWSKSMVRRVLENNKYCGDGEYPQLITKQAYQLATQIRKSKAPIATEGLNVIRKYIKCAHCGANRQLDTHKRPLLQWLCQSCGSQSAFLSKTDLLEKVREKLSLLFDGSFTISAPEVTYTLTSIKMIRLTREISRSLEKQHIDEEVLVTMLIERAAEQYKLCSAGVYDPATMRLRQFVASNCLSEYFDETIFKKIVIAVIMDEQSNIQLELINHQVI